MKRTVFRLAIALIRLAMFTFPKRLRDRYEGEPSALFAERLNEHLHRGLREGLLFAASNVSNTVWAGLRARSEERRIRTPAGSPILDSVLLVGRTLVRGRKFALLVAIPMALSLGTGTTVFSIADAVLIRDLPVPDSDRLYLVGTVSNRTGEVRGMSVANFEDIRDELTTVESSHMVQGGGVILQRPQGPARVPVFRVSEGVLELTGARTAIGRPLVQSDFREHRTVLLSYEAWTTGWGQDPGVIGRSVSFNGETREIVGVLAPGTRLPNQLGGWQSTADLWFPIDFSDPIHQASRAFGFARAVVKVPSLDQLDVVRSELEAQGAGLADAYPEQNTWSDGTPKTLGAVSLKEATVGDASQRVFLLAAATALLLLIAIANSANLVLLRASERTREVALRMAIGASRGRVVAELMLEAVIVCAAAGFAGLLIATWETRMFIALAPEGLPRLHEIGVDGRVMAFGILLALLSGLLVGALPAFLTARRALYDRLRGTTSTTSRGEARARGLFVAIQTAIALALAVNAGLLVTSLSNLVNLDRGFDVEDLWAMRVTLAQHDYGSDAEMLATFMELRERLAALPGVQAATGSVFMMGESAPVTVDLEVGGEDMGPRPAHNVLPDYFETLGIRVLHGRAFTADDHRSDSPRTVILSQSLAAELFPDGGAIGAELEIPDSSEEVDGAWTVAGIVSDTRSAFRATEPEGIMYLPYAPWSWIGSVVMTVRATTGLQGFEELMPAALVEIDDRVPLNPAFRVGDFLSDEAGEPRFYAWLLSAFSVLALTLAAMGLYVTLSYSVSRRTRELAIRMALGAQVGTVLESVLRGALIVTVIGGVIGYGLTRVSGRMLEGLLFQLAPNDLGTFLVAAMALTAAAVLAALAPGRRAITADPARVLRED